MENCAAERMAPPSRWACMVIHALAAERTSSGNFSTSSLDSGACAIGGVPAGTPRILPNGQ